jgi:hypothetical protein
MFDTSFYLQISMAFCLYHKMSLTVFTSYLKWDNIYFRWFVKFAFDTHDNIYNWSVKCDMKNICLFLCITMGN